MDARLAAGARLALVCAAVSALSSCGAGGSPDPIAVTLSGTVRLLPISLDPRAAPPAPSELGGDLDVAIYRTGSEGYCGAPLEGLAALRRQVLVAPSIDQLTGAGVPYELTLLAEPDQTYPLVLYPTALLAATSDPRQPCELTPTGLRRSALAVAGVASPDDLAAAASPTCVLKPQPVTVPAPGARVTVDLVLVPLPCP
jgi:hypothetical protein